MKCNNCLKGFGRNHVKCRKTGMVYFYYCAKCIGDYTKNSLESDQIKELKEHFAAISEFVSGSNAGREFEEWINNL